MLLMSVGNVTSAASSYFLQVFYSVMIDASSRGSFVGAAEGILREWFVRDHICTQLIHISSGLTMWPPVGVVTLTSWLHARLPYLQLYYNWDWPHSWAAMYPLFSKYLLPQQGLVLFWLHHFSKCYWLNNVFARVVPHMLLDCWWHCTALHG